MNYIVLDLEWNQPFSVKSMIRTPIPLWGEIIQIGAVKLDEGYHILDTFKIIVTPKYYKRMNKKVAKLTKITTEELQYGFPFEVSFKHFRKWCGEDFVFLTWGPDDIGVLRDNMAVHNIDTEWLPATYNLQIIFDNQVTKENRQISLTDAMEKIGAVGREAHDALNDAHNTANICLHLDMKKGLDEYKELQKKPREICSDALAVYRADAEYPTRLSAIEAFPSIEACCPNCGEKLSFVDMVKQNNTKYICIGKCHTGEEFFVRFRMRKRVNKKYIVSCILYELDEKHREYYEIIKKTREEKRQKYIEAIDNAS